MLVSEKAYLEIRIIANAAVGFLRVLGEPVPTVGKRLALIPPRQIGRTELVRGQGKSAEKLIIEHRIVGVFISADLGDIQCVTVFFKGVPVILPRHTVLIQPAETFDHTLCKYHADL